MAKASIFDRKHPAAPLFALNVDPVWIARMVGFNEGRAWLAWLWGPAPGETGCGVPKQLLGAVTWRTDDEMGEAA